jgi:hypothetical protein
MSPLEKIKGLGAVSEWCLQKEEERILNIIDLLD